MKQIQNIDTQYKKVLVRCDFNSPLSQEGTVLDDFRIEKTLPTIEYLIKKNAKIILMSHLGRPEGKFVESLKLDPIAAKLSQLLNRDIKKINDCVGKEVEDVIRNMHDGEIVLLENLRFHKEEEENDNSFAKKLAGLGDIFINDAFGASHRSHASIVGVPKYLAFAAGMLLEQEVVGLSRIIKNPKKPLLVLMGGAKATEKAELINKLSNTADFVLIGGLIQKEIREKNIQLRFPEKVIGPIDEIYGGKDIGEKTRFIFKEKISSAGTIFFNGVMGQVETEEYAKGTEDILKAITESSAFSVVGGGDMTKVIKKLSLMEKFGHISTGGGAMMEFLSGKKLPGIEALR